jgi:hypothetical protein
LFRLRLDERIDRVASLIVATGRALDRADRKLRGLFTPSEMNR